MPQVVEQIRHVCTLGAFESVLAIKRAVPIMHADPAAELSSGLHWACKTAARARVCRRACYSMHKCF